MNNSKGIPIGEQKLFLKFCW